jgi:hypothetical protein
MRTLAIPVGFIVSASTTVGDLIVGIGTLSLAWYTRKLARATYALDLRSAARETQRRERRARGVGRLIDGELEAVERHVELALTSGLWPVSFTFPCRAWNRHGALVVESVHESQARRLTNLFTSLASWRESVTGFHTQYPGKTGKPVEGEREVLTVIRQQLQEARSELRLIAYPDS